MGLYNLDLVPENRFNGPAFTDPTPAACKPRNTTKGFIDGRRKQSLRNTPAKHAANTVDLVVNVSPTPALFDHLLPKCLE
jgi:hypothetical protein